jgi:D-alanyl-D-alanine carboxypeptidase/D-alanyl-D-alanine-endopeptidase (penicillin-binding protein 4)
LQDTAVRNAHVGISIYDATKNKYVYNYQADHFFTPASNNKLFTCYAAMKYLGDSIIGLRYYASPDTLYLLPTGDPTLLYHDFTINPVSDFLKANTKPVSISDAYWKDNRWGEGWSWDDYMEDYMAERNPCLFTATLRTQHLLTILQAVYPLHYFIFLKHRMLQKVFPILSTLI